MRIELLLSISRSPGCLHELAKRHQLEVDVVCKHLGFLKRAGFVQVRVEGSHHFYSLGERASVYWSDSRVEVTLQMVDDSEVAARLPIALAKEVLRSVEAPADLRPVVTPRGTLGAGKVPGSNP